MEIRLSCEVPTGDESNRVCLQRHLKIHEEEQPSWHCHKKHHGPGTLLGDDTTQSSYPQDCQKIKGWWRNPTDKPNLFMIDCDSAAG